MDVLSSERPPDWSQRLVTLAHSPRGHAFLALRWGMRLVLVGSLVLGWTAAGLPGNPMPLWMRAMGLVILLPTTVMALVVLRLRWIRPRSTAFIRRWRRLAAGRGVSPGTDPIAWHPLKDISSTMVLATVSTEDPYFYWHSGFSPADILAAFHYNRRDRKAGRKLRGGSTISQQLVKNLFLSPEQTYRRKVIEALLTVLLEGFLSKRRILELYLNVVEFGDGVFGIGAASRIFFRTAPLQLTAAQSALLAVSLRAPSLYRVERPSAASRDLQAKTLRRMAWCEPGVIPPLLGPGPTKGSAIPGVLPR